MVFKDIDGNRRTLADYGATWLSDERIAELGLTVVDDGYQPPVPEPTKAEKVAALDAEYQPQFAELAQNLGVATLDGNQAAINGIKDDYAALKAEYTEKMGALA